VYGLTDTAVVGHLGRTPLVGLALAATVLNVVGWSAGFLTMATTSRVAFRRGRGDQPGAASVAAAAFTVAVALGLAAAATYLRISAAGLPFLFLTLAGTGFLQGLEDTKAPLRILALSNAVNIVLEVVLVYGLHTGLAGSAWGTVAAQVVAAGCFVVTVRRRVRGAPVRPTRGDIGLLLRDARPIVVRTVALGAAITGSSAVAARVGGTTLAAHQITVQVWLLLALIVDALAVPAQVFVGAALGRADPDDAVLVGQRCLRLGVLVAAVLTVLTCASAPVLPYVFTGDGAVRQAATLGLLVCGLQQGLAAAAFVLDGLLLGAADYGTLRRAMLLSLIAYAPFAVVTLLDHRWGIVGVWLALSCWLAARTALLGRRWRSAAWAMLPARAA
jgi:putative MATE family efflux protein